MSSDVYLDFNEGKENADSVRIGHLGIMGHDVLRYHDEDLMGRLRTLQIASGGVVHEWVPDAAARLCDRFKHFVKKFEADPPYYAMGRDLWESGFDDFPTDDSIAQDFRENIGKTWDLRVD